MPALMRLRPYAAARLAAALALGAAGLATAGMTPATTASSTTVAAAPCLTKASAERVRADSGLQGVDPNDLTAAQTQASESRLQARTASRRFSLQKQTSTSRRIDVYVHVIEKNNGKGGVSTKRIKKQISVLNAAYAGTSSKYSTRTGFTFKLKKIDRTKSSTWYAWSRPDVDDSDDVAAKTKLHKGGTDDLNIYIASLSDGLLGYATFPWESTEVTDGVASPNKRDGVVLLNNSLPGGSAKGYNAGDTATHEIGHWLGLLHTFENGCDDPGDEVDDTPAQADGMNIFSCDETLDTCQADGLNDPVHNFMSYGNDACLSRFTPGQVDRMVQNWEAYRVPVSPS